MSTAPTQSAIAGREMNGFTRLRNGDLLEDIVRPDEGLIDVESVTAMRYACSKDARLKKQLPSTKGLL